MMKAVVVFAFLVFIAPFSASADTFWVSLGADDDSNEPIFLMKIDENGTILMPATVVVPRSSVASTGSGELPTALAHGPGNTLILWIGNDVRNLTYRALVDKTTLDVLVVKKILSGYDFDFLQSGPLSSSFVIYEKKEARVFAQRMDSNGLPVVGEKFRPTYVRFIDKASVSADGTLTLVDDDTNNKLYANPLNPVTGSVTGPYLVTDNDNVCDVDVTNILPNGQRIAVFADCNFDRYFLVHLEGATGRRIGRPVQLTNLEIGEVDQEIALDPEGRFVIFSVDDADTGCTTGTDIPVFVPLNPNTGDVIGTPKALTPCDITEPYGSGDIFGINILKE